MIIRSGLGILPFLFLVPSLADSDSLWFSSEDGNLPGTDFSSNEGALALGGPVLPSDSSSLLSDTSDSLFEDPQDTDLFLSANPDLIGDQSFEIADCSALASLPPVNGKSRAKRIDGVTSCRNPDLQLDPSSPLLHEDSDIIKHLEESWLTVPSRKELDHNRICRAITLNMLPWGACSNPGPVWTKRVNPMYPLMEDPRIVGIQLYDLEQCTICKG